LCSSLRCPFLIATGYREKRKEEEGGKRKGGGRGPKRIGFTLNLLHSLKGRRKKKEGGGGGKETVQRKET